MVYPQKRLTRKESADYLKEKWGITRTPKTLAKLASAGCGPKYQTDGRDALSLPDWLDEWASEILHSPAGKPRDCRD